MSKHTYTRSLVNGKWNLDNELRVDGNGDKIPLFKEVKDALPGEPFKLTCEDENAEFDFTNELDSDEVITLGTVVLDHKNNS